jgi:PKD repeat protein
MQKQFLFLSVLLAMACLTMTNCKKEEEPTVTTTTPTTKELFVDFSFVKKTTASSACGHLDAGLVGFTNLARNATSIKWTFGDGSQPFTSTTSYIEHQYAQKGNYTITLEARDSAKTLTKVRTVTVLGEGCIVLHKADVSAPFPLKITLNGQEKTINQNEISCANCCTNATPYGNSIASFKAPSGTYSYTVKNNNGTTIATNNATVNMGECKKIGF